MLGSNPLPTLKVIGILQLLKFDSLPMFVTAVLTLDSALVLFGLEIWLDDQLPFWAHVAA